MSPVFFTVVTLALTSTMLSVILCMAWKTQGRKRHALTWSVTFLFASAHWMTLLLADAFPSQEVYRLVAQAFLLLTVSLALLGHLQRVGRAIPSSGCWAPPALCYALIAWFTIVSPHVGLQTGLGPAYAAATLLVSAALVIGHRNRPRPAEWGAAVTMIVLAASQLFASGAAFMQGATASQTYLDVYLQVNLLTLPAIWTGMGMFIVFMLASDLSERMKEIAVVDQLTGLLNRRGFAESCACAYAEARRSGRTVSVIMTDIDRFKDINDRFGHFMGDQALCHFAAMLRIGRSENDILARTGGEEFALVLPDTGVEESIRIAEDLCRRLEATPMQTDGEQLTMTASFGVAAISEKDACLSDVVVRADSALYKSKRAGRNRIDLESSQIMLMPDGALKSLSRG